MTEIKRLAELLYLMLTELMWVIDEPMKTTDKFYDADVGVVYFMLDEFKNRLVDAFELDESKLDEEEEKVNKIANEKYKEVFGEEET